MIWSIMGVASKVLYLAGMAAVIGGAGAYLLFLSANMILVRKILGYVVTFAAIGMFGSVTYFMSQIGMLNDAGLMGMFDRSMAGMLMDTSLGTASFYRIVGFLTAISVWLVVFYDSRDERLSISNPLMILVLLIIGGGIFAWSTTVTGHVSTLDLVTRTVLGVHILAVFAWIGSLWPLRTICSFGDSETLALIMKRYGNIAAWIVTALILSGLWMVFQLLNEPEAILASAYGRVLALKIVVVTGALAIAARHKYSLVPGLINASAARRLQWSIDMEIGVVLLVVLVTAILTTVVGPEMDH
jgi:putative copper resistance protein D